MTSLLALVVAEAEDDDDEAVIGTTAIPKVEEYEVMAPDGALSSGVKVVQVLASVAEVVDEEIAAAKLVENRAVAARTDLYCIFFF